MMYLMKKKDGKRYVGWCCCAFLAAVIMCICMFCADRTAVYATSTARITRTEKLALTETEQENAQEGWSWKRDEGSGMSYTLTLDQVNFEVSNDSAITLYTSQGIPITSVKIVLIGENRVVSTNIPASDSSFYNACGIYMDAYDAETAPAVSICGGGSLTLEGYRRGVLLNGTKTGGKSSLTMEGVNVNIGAENNRGIFANGDLTIKDSTVSIDTFSVGHVTVENSTLTAAPAPLQTSSSNSVLSATDFRISDSSITIQGAAGFQYAGMSCDNSMAAVFQNSSLDIRNVDYGIHITAGRVELDHVTGRLSCFETMNYKNSLMGGSGAFACNGVDVTDSVVFAQADEDLLIYGDVTMPEDITELTLAGDLLIQDGNTFIVGENQKISFTKNYTTIFDTEASTLVNYGTIDFAQSTVLRTKLVNYGTLTAPNIQCQHEQIANYGTFDGIIVEQSGMIQYDYGNVKTTGNRTVGNFTYGDYKTTLTPGTVLTISNGNTFNASNPTWETLGEYLIMEEGSRIIIEEGGKLLLPPDDTDSQVFSMNLSGMGTVQIGDIVLQKVFYMDGDTMLSDAFANQDGIVVQPPEPQKEGGIFEGWYTALAGGEKFDFHTAITDSQTLYARWVERKEIIQKPHSSIFTNGSNELVYGQTLSELELSSTVFVEQESGRIVEGSIVWKNPSEMPNAGTIYAEWIFTPTDSIHYTQLTGTVEIVVKKAVPYIAELPEASQITYGSTLGDSVLTGGRVQCSASDDTVVEGSFQWKDASVKPAVSEGNIGFTVIFTPNDANYDCVEMTVMLSVKSESNASGSNTSGSGTSGSETSGSNTSGSGTSSSNTSGTGYVPDYNNSSGNSGSSSRPSVYPYIKDNSGKRGWLVIKDEADRSKAGNVITVEMAGTVVVPKDVLEHICDRDITMIFDMGNDFTWTVYGKDIEKESIQSINFSVKTAVDDVIPQDILEQTADGKQHVELVLAHDGAFGFKTVLSAKTKSRDGYANLFYYNPQNRSLEFICADKIAEDGTVHLTFIYASVYTIIYSEQPMGGIKEPADETEPSESDDEQKEEDARVDVGEVKLSKTVFTYSGKAKKPSVTVLDTEGRKISDKYYTVTYKNNKKTGRATVIVQLKDGYSGTVKEIFTIRPQITTVKKTVGISGGFTVKWKKITAQTSGYQIQYSTDSKFKKAVSGRFVKSNTVTKKTVKKLKAGKKYYVRIRTYKTVKEGEKSVKIYSGWSRAKQVQTLAAE